MVMAVGATPNLGCAVTVTDEKSCFDKFKIDHEVSLFNLINYHFIYIDDENINFIIKTNLK